MKKHYVVLILLMLKSFVCSVKAGDEVLGKVRFKIFREINCFDSCDTHRWKGEGWGGTTPEVSTTNFQGKQCLRVYFNTGTYGYLRVDWMFQPEDWQNWGVEKVNMWIYPVGTSQADVMLEVKDSVDSLVGQYWVNDIPENQWNDVSWTVGSSTHVARIYLRFDGLPSTPTTFYIDNIRLILSGGTTKYWDLLDGSFRWKLEKDAKTYGQNEHFDPISSINPFSGSCSLRIEWDANLDSDVYAQAVYDYPINGGQNWSDVLCVRAKVWCTTNAAPISINCCDGINWRATEEKTPSAANTWQTLEWWLDKSPGFNWSSLTWIVIRVKTTDVQTGLVYIDDIYIYKK